MRREIKLHLGCGKKYLPDFLHIDLIDCKHIDYKHDVSNLPMFKNNSVDLIYSCHVLEHFKRFEIENVLKEWYRILKKGGILRIAVPDFESIVKAYEKYEKLELIMGLLYGGQDYKYNFHYVTFDFKYLKKVLLKTGFRDCYRYNWQDTIHKNYDDFSQAYIPHMDKQNGILMSLNVEAIK